MPRKSPFTSSAFSFSRISKITPRHRHESSVAATLSPSFVDAAGEDAASDFEAPQQQQQQIPQARWWYWHGLSAGWQAAPPPPLHSRGQYPAATAPAASLPNSYSSSPQSSSSLTNSQQQDASGKPSSLFRLFFPYLVSFLVISELFEYFVTEMIVGTETATHPSTPTKRITVEERKNK